MPPRRSHKKSRAGCKRCKARKIKCDEIHPRCSNCVKHGVLCDFEHPDIADVLSPIDTPPLSVSTPDYNPSPSASTCPPTPAIPTSTPTPMYRQPDMPLVSASSKNNRMMELKLLHHYTTMTCKTLALNDTTMGHTVWQDTVPSIAFSGASFLADALLAVSALHMRCNYPNDQELVRASHSYMASTLSEYSARLSQGINESNAEALFLTASLIAFQSTASRIFTRDESGDLKERSDSYVLPLSWFHSFQGVKTVVATSWQWLRNSLIVVPIIQAQPALKLDLSDADHTFFGHLLVGLNEELARIKDTNELLLVRQAYQHAVAVLNWAHKIPHTGAPLVFLATVSRKFIELLEARQPRALAILASFFGLLKCLDNVWWLKGVARREVLGILSLFDTDDEVWWPRLQWPLRIVMFDGDAIPTDVWGADWAAEKELLDQAKTTGDSTVSHIELLTKMLTAMQQAPMGAPQSFDIIPHQQAVVAERGGYTPSSDDMTDYDLYIPQVD